jgi:hypothetical protein
MQKKGRSRVRTRTGSGAKNAGRNLSRGASNAGRDIGNGANDLLIKAGDAIEGGFNEATGTMVQGIEDLGDALEYNKAKKGIKKFDKDMGRAADKFNNKRGSKRGKKRDR